MKCGAFNRHNGNKNLVNTAGVTLIELLVVVSIVLVLFVALAFSYQGWIGRFRVESQVKEMYSDFMKARARAIERCRVHFITGADTSYTLYEDTQPGPDGNGDLNAGTGGDTILPTFPKTVPYKIDWAGTGTQIDFNRNGMITLPLSEAADPTTGSIFLITTNDADYDCINVSPLKVYMGKKNATTNKCDSK